MYRRGAKYLSNKLLIVREIKKELRLNSSPSLLPNFLEVTVVT